MTSDLNLFINPEPIPTSSQELVQEASLCLDRFTAAFNTCDTERMDTELHFPHCMYSGSELMIWNSAGQHPSDFLKNLKLQAGQVLVIYTSIQCLYQKIKCIMLSNTFAATFTTESFQITLTCGL
jgi:hypothetical protein